MMSELLKNAQKVVRKYGVQFNTEFSHDKINPFLQGFRIEAADYGNTFSDKPC